jgi:hypothetical protein
VWTLVEQWSKVLETPRVEMVWFEDAGHFLAVEAPEAFQARLIEQLLPLLPPAGDSGSARAGAGSSENRAAVP